MAGEGKEQNPACLGLLEGSGICDVHFLLGSAAGWVELPAESSGDGGS